MSEFKKPKVNPDENHDIFLEVDDWYSWRVQRTDSPVLDGWSLWTLESAVWWLGLGAEKKTEPETQIVKELGGPTRWVGEDIMSRVLWASKALLRRGEEVLACEQIWG